MPFVWPPNPNFIWFSSIVLDAIAWSNFTQHSFVHDHLCRFLGVNSFHLVLLSIGLSPNTCLAFSSGHPHAHSKIMSYLVPFHLIHLAHYGWLIFLIKIHDPDSLIRVHSNLHMFLTFYLISDHLVWFIAWHKSFDSGASWSTFICP